MPQNSNNNFELRESEIQEIISRPPSALVRWGLAVFFFAFILFLFLTWFIRYPDIIKAKVIVTTNPAPINLVSRTSGKIVLWKPDNCEVKPDEPVAFIESNARPQDVIAVDLITLLPDSDYKALSKIFVLGDLQNAFSQWEKAKENRNLFYQNQIAAKQIGNLEGQIISHKKLAQSMQSQLKIMREELDLAKTRFKTDSSLYQQKVTSAIDFNKAKTDFLVQQRNLKNEEMTIINNELQVSSLEKQITELQGSKSESSEKLTLEVEHSKKELRAQILKWKEAHLFVAPTRGSLAYLDFLENGKFVESGKAVFSVVPAAKEIIGRVELPIVGSGKVKKGQHVNIRLDNFPYEQYGMLRGDIKEISSLPSQDKYLAIISLPDTLKTTSQKSLVFKQQMQGETEIITEDLRLIERFFYQSVKMLKSR